MSRLFVDHRLAAERVLSAVQNKAGDIFQEPESFTVEVDAPKDVRELLEKYLELERYRHFAGLRPSELRRLLGASDGNIRNLLGSIGYFSPTIELELREQPRDSGIPPTVIVKVDPGPATKISRVDISFSGTNADDPKGSFIRRSIERNWDLPVGETFSQSEWSSAKTKGCAACKIAATPRPSCSAAVPTLIPTPTKPSSR